ncbi:hypothetical protein [Streptomyces sp. NRRL B-24085]|uniref:hypothetical protein n=1 Tax=Streptomyces sp. NRRL B-24085 TaxID=1709476 RepID=UPI00117FF13D|nr:hypothetical protein [Streptomyces sp. NRRL B-24085]
MNTFRHARTAVAVAAVLLATACQENVDPTAAPQSHSAASATAGLAASPSPAAKTRDEVISDFRYATKSFDLGLTVVKDPMNRNCVAHSTAFSRTEPGEKDLLRVVSRLKERGWRLRGEVDADGATFLESGGWEAITGVGPLPGGTADQHSSAAGALALSATSTCTKPPSPSRVKK